MIQKKFTEKYRLICIYFDQPIISRLNIGNIVENPHIHIVRSKHIKHNRLIKYSKDFSGEPNTLYQWGQLNALKNKSRVAIVTEAERSRYGGVGLGSVARGDETLNNFIGGGEGFIWNNIGYRVAKGGKLFKIGLDERFWFLQVCSFMSPIAIDGIQHIAKRNDILKNVQNFFRNSFSFMASFEYKFHTPAFSVRSNGVFPEDTLKGDNAEQLISPNNGGHLLDSKYGIIGEIIGPILVEPLNTLKIIDEDCSIKL